VPAPNQQVRSVDIWDMDPTKMGPDSRAEQHLVLNKIDEHLIREVISKRGGAPVMGPSPWGMLLVRSYVRHLCRLHGATVAKVVRRTREPVSPTVMFLPQQPDGELPTLVSNFGEVKP
jgi:hypothetical protein